MASTLTFHFRPQGPGRFVLGGFLSVWLCGWAAGEVFVLVMLSRLLREWAAADGPLGEGTASSTGMSMGMTAALSGFLLLWVSLWTLGGIMALREWLRCFWADERLVLNAEGLTLRSRLGPFGRRRRIPSEEIRHCEVRGRGQHQGALVVELTDRVMELTRLGTGSERQSAADALNAALGLRPGAAPPTAGEGVEAMAPRLPRRWQELEGAMFESPVLVPNLANRRLQTAVMAVVTGVFGALTFLLCRSALGQASYWIPAGIVALLALGCCWGTLWLLLGRRELRLEHHQLVVQRRFGRSLREVAQLESLELVEVTDSDGDAWYKLQGHRPLGKPLTLSSAINNAAEPRALGLWLHQRTQIPYRDAIPSQSEREQQRAATVLALKQRLGESGRAGSWMLKLVEQIEPNKNPPPAPPP
ncbi:hypothetical protein KBY97_01980 [Synechococcus sp. ATX 2A4]|uniref:hypothetical protein n=1 Tax=Synechococcus sp. ATX 2A4 TaxID=2823727 RepID=UPI0020CDBB46|nr:hypothetical protein [Synechococcus sp. ATX 2A4]MCP9883897.1 hypothetical protein [Synechococcus sp. ATX 2A4]